MRLIFAGGGSAHDSRPLDEKFASWLGVNARLLYLPIAMDGVSRSYHDSLAWLESVFEPHGIRQITMCTEPDTCLERDLLSYDGIYIGGGNTYRLLHLLRQDGFDQAIVDYARHGGAIYGGSAGAILLGRDINTAAYMDDNEYGLQDTRGLDLAHGFSIWCHYQPADDARVVAYMSQTGFPVLALSERSGACMEGVRLTACGFQPARIFSPGAPARETWRGDLIAAPGG
jgi:dipeptidase E